MTENLEPEFMTADDEAHHFDLYNHVRFQPTYAGRTICLECREIAMGSPVLLDYLMRNA